LNECLIMKRYIEQLIEDMRAAAIAAPPDPFDNPDLDDDEAFEMEMEETERFVNGPYQKLADIVGIDKIMLPAPERLAEGDMQKLIPEIVALLNAYHFQPEYPEKVPPLMIYQALYNIWDDDFVQMRFGTVHIDFCDYDPETCPFPGYCTLCQENEETRKLIPENEFHIHANPLKGDEGQIDQDFVQMEDEYYQNHALTDPEGFILGIHNFCDRWCERCDFADKCRVFEMEKEMMDSLNEEAPGSDKSSDTETKTEEADQSPELDDWFDDFPESDDEDLEDDIFDDGEYSMEDYEADQNDFFGPYQKADREPMIQMAHEYSMDAQHWFRHRDKEMEAGFLAELAKGFGDEVLEAEEVMGWYCVFIYVKLKRAIMAYYERDEIEDDGYNMNGTAKVALIALDRSIEAASILIRHLKAHRRQIKVFRHTLEKIRTMAEELFPEARDFVRPGLDEL